MCYFGVEELSRPSITESRVDWTRAEEIVLMMAQAFTLHPKTLFHTKTHSRLAETKLLRRPIDITLQSRLFRWP